MNKIDQMRQIEAVTDARYQQQQQSFQRLVSEENRLRSELMKLDAHLKEARSAQVEFEMTALGADIIWQAWVGKRKAELNMKLAQVLSIKEHHLKQVRTAYGKLLVARELLSDAMKSQGEKKAQSALLRAIEMSLDKGGRQ